MRRRVALELVIPLAVLLVLTVILGAGLDVAIESQFYSDSRGWYFADVGPWQWLYDHGNIPSLVLSIGSLVVLVAGYVTARLARYRKVAVFFVLAMIIGPGIFVNAVFKDHWGRPRPQHVHELGGPFEYRPVWAPEWRGTNYSFPSGHASMGFYMMLPFFLLRTRSRGWAYGFLVSGLILGSAIGFGRMIQGGHFPSDILWSAGVVYLTGWALCHWMGFHRTESR